jgi:hypothetical protein
MQGNLFSPNTTRSEGHEPPMAPVYANQYISLYSGIQDKTSTPENISEVIWS